MRSFPPSTFTFRKARVLVFCLGCFLKTPSHRSPLKFSVVTILLFHLSPLSMGLLSVWKGRPCFPSEPWGCLWSATLSLKWYIVSPNAFPKVRPESWPLLCSWGSLLKKLISEGRFCVCSFPHSRLWSITSLTAWQRIWTHCIHARYLMEGWA